jgi:hypothetical protein
MLKGAPHVETAELFIEFVLSAEGQKLWFFKKGRAGGPEKQELDRMTIRPDFYEKYDTMSNIKQNPFTSSGKFIFNNSLSAQRWSLINDLIGIALIDRNNDLQLAWRHMHNPQSFLSDTTWQNMPLSEADCLQLTGHEWQNPIRKNEILLSWHNFFTEKYKRLSK